MFKYERKAIILALAVSWAAVHGAYGQTIRMGPLRPGEFVRDLAGLLDSDDKQRGHEICAAVSADGIAPVVVVTIKSVQAHSSAGMPFEAFSVLLFDHLKNGAAAASGPEWNKGILLLVSLEDRKVGIELGPGWGHEHYVSARQIKEGQILPLFKRERFSEGIVAGLVALDKLARGEELPRAPSTWWYAPVVLILKGLALVLTVTAIGVGAWYGKQAWGRFFGTRVLFDAVRAGDEERVSKCLKAGAQADSSDVRGTTPIFHASRDGYLEIVILLLEHDARLNIRTQRGDSPLFQAAQEGYTDVVEVLLAHGAHANAPTKAGVTPVIVASRRGNLDVVELLVKNGAALDAQNNHGLTSLFAAVEKGHEEVASFLLDSGADVNRPTNEGITPLMRSVLTVKKSGDPDILLLLLSHGADVNEITPPPEHTTALMMAVQLSEVDTVKLLLNAGADMDLQYNSEVDSIGLAERKENKVLVSLLKEHKAKGTAEHNMLDAVRRGDLARAAQVLKGKPHHVHVVTAHNQWTSLHLAAMEGNRTMVEFLLSKGADVHAKSKNGQSARDVVPEPGHEELVAFLKDAETSKVGILEAVGAGDQSRVKEILHTMPNQVRITSANKKWTPLHLAVMDGNREMVDLLLANGANMHATNTDGKTPLTIADDNGHEELAALLRGYESDEKENHRFLNAVGAGDIDTVEKELLRTPTRIRVVTANRKWTALHLATMDTNEEMVELLLHNGADVNAANKDGKTSAHHAAGRGNVHILTLLLAHGADLGLKYNGRTPLDRAREMGHTETVDLLTGAESASPSQG